MKHLKPILSNKIANEYEQRYFGDDFDKIYGAISKVSEKIAKEIIAEFGNHIGNDVKLLALIGKGKNGADGLLSILNLSKYIKNLKVYLKFITKEEDLGKFTQKALSQLKENIEVFDFDKKETDYDMLIEALVGMNYQVRENSPLDEIISMANKVHSRLKITIDLPAKSSTGEIFVADVCYATAIAKEELFDEELLNYRGRVRFVDIFDEVEVGTDKYIIADSIRENLMGLRKSHTHKYNYGNVIILGGSMKYKGALLLNVKTALRSGAGIVQACLPEELQASFASAEPSAIWIGAPTNDEGAHSLESLYLFRDKISKADVFLCGSGLTNSPEAKQLIIDILKLNQNPNLKVILDADAIKLEILQTTKDLNLKTIITPHAGEFLRIHNSTSNEALLDFAKRYKCHIALKEDITRICDSENIVYSTRGNPSLAKGGSGDMLAGLMAGFCARFDLKTSAMLACHTMGLCADICFNKFGQDYTTSQTIIDNLHKAFTCKIK